MIGPEIDARRITKEAWDRSLKGWSIVQCALRNRSVLSLVLRKDIDDEDLTSLSDSEVPTRVFNANLDARVNGHAEFSRGMRFPRLGTSVKPESFTLCAARDRVGSVWVTNPAYSAMEHIVPEAADDPTRRLVIRRVKRVNGYAYAVSLFRRIYRRDDVNRWNSLDAGFPVLTPRQIEKQDFGFNDIDGADERTLYGVGGRGDVWRYDGTLWRQCDFPSNEQLGTVTVAPNGQVYISGEGGNLWVGNEDTWKLLHRGASSILYNESVWFNDMLWLCSGLQLRVWDGKYLRRPTYNGVDVVYTGHMDAFDDLLVIAGERHVYSFDGTDWQCLVAPYE